MLLIVTDQNDTAVCLSWPTVLAHSCVLQAHAANSHIDTCVYMASQVNVLSATNLVRVRVIYLTFCYLAILVTLHVHWMS